MERVNYYQRYRDEKNVIIYFHLLFLFRRECRGQGKKLDSIELCVFFLVVHERGLSESCYNEAPRPISVLLHFGSITNLNL